MAGPYRLAADIGGTFTDIALALDDGTVATNKIPSSPEDFGDAVVKGILELTSRLDVPLEAASEFLHGCTVATNAILERKGARTALITTRGFRDVLELRRIRVPNLYDPLYVKPEPLVPRDLRFEIDERMGPGGEVLRPLNSDDLETVIAALRNSAVEAVAVTLLHSYANPDHEIAIGAALRQGLPGVFVTLSHEILPEIREYERTSTTVISSYLGPVVSAYLQGLVGRLKEQGLQRRLLVMQSSGGVANAEEIIKKPALIAESGPAAGVTAARIVGRTSGYRDIISLDMGGTSAKASIIEDGRVAVTDQYEVGSTLSAKNTLLRGGGYALKMPILDISEIGAGGGSIVALDEAGAIRIGPESAGAIPGPACYGLGGTDPTVTDANLALGYLNPRQLAGGAMRIDRELALAAIERNIAKPLGLSVQETAYGIHRVTNSHMIRAIKSVSVQRGRDPGNFVLMAFGGSGGIHAVDMARSLNIPRVVIPPVAGVFSALGLLAAEVETTLSVAFLSTAEEASPSKLASEYGRLEDEIARALERESQELRFERYAEIRYVDQAFELRIPAVEGAIGAAWIAAMKTAFDAEHERKYGHSFGGGSAIEFVSIGVIGRLARTDRPFRFGAATNPREESTRSAYFGPDVGERTTPVVGRMGLRESPREGPLIVEEMEGTTVVPPGARVHLDENANIVISVS
jgi:N-methylhydantoinase A